MKKNYLLNKIKEIFLLQERGKILDLGCGDGEYSIMLKELGFDVVSGDIDEKRFKFHKQIIFKHCDITKEMPFPKNYFDYIVLTEVLEHLRNPYTVLTEINRIIKDGGYLILSTPNILNLKSRVRFMFEGSYEYFREPPLDQVINPKEVVFNLHLFPYRYHELEYLLNACGFKISNIFSSICQGFALGFLLPIIKFQTWGKENRSKRKKGIDYSRINKIMLSRDLLFGRHLIIKAKK